MSLFQPLFYVYGKEMLQLAGMCLTNTANHEFSLKTDGRFYLQSFCVNICKTSAKYILSFNTILPSSPDVFLINFSF